MAIPSPIGELTHAAITDGEPGRRPRSTVVRRLARWIAFGLLAILLTGMLAWAALAVYFADTHAGPRRMTAALYVIVAVTALVIVRPRRLGLAAFAAIFATVVG